MLNSDFILVLNTALLSEVTKRMQLFKQPRRLLWMKALPSSRNNWHDFMLKHFNKAHVECVHIIYMKFIQKISINNGNFQFSNSNIGFFI